MVLAILAKRFCHFKTKIEEHIKKDSKAHCYKHLNSILTYFDSYNSFCFKIIDKFDFEIKETLHINWRKPNLNAQQNHLALTHCSFSAPLLFSVFVVGAVDAFVNLLRFTFIYCFHYF